ncbi:unnamed protein product [Paramecium pentaurelia]|uniref:Protein kinase domain-containing protein n=1 Tax=Paramecium pentaurelia TaxID=43138 RepID=A0A8S1VM98_9CILI|nr:unnamed protein product [Paramecium pentaurelia]
MIYIKKLGQFGSVYMCKNKKDGKLYALKCIIKTYKNHLIQEKTVLEQIQFPLMMRFYKSMKDDIKGLELFNEIRDIELLNVYDSQFYVSSLLLCMEYLHTLHIVYRDIKLENLMVDHNGFIHLIDMGTAKIFKGKGCAFTIIGNPHYMIPEILNVQGLFIFSVSESVCMNLCVEEFLLLKMQKTHMKYMRKLQGNKFHIKIILKIERLKKFIDQLLNRTPQIRIEGNYAALKANTWFNGLVQVFVIQLKKIQFYILLNQYSKCFSIFIKFCQFQCTIIQDKLTDKELKPPQFHLRIGQFGTKKLQQLRSKIRSYRVKSRLQDMRQGLGYQREKFIQEGISKRSLLG